MSYAADALGANAMRRMPEWMKRAERILEARLERGEQIRSDELIWLVKRRLHRDPSYTKWLRGEFYP